MFPKWWFDTGFSGVDLLKISRLICNFPRIEALFGAFVHQSQGHFQFQYRAQRPEANQAGHDEPSEPLIQHISRDRTRCDDLKNR